MRLLSRTIFREVFASALLGTVLFTFVLFLQRLQSQKQLEIIMRSSAPPKTLAYLFSLLLPPALIFAIPLGVLVGVLIGLSRMSSDGEITAMRAAGVPSRRVISPVMLFATLSMMVTATASIYLTPYSLRETYRILNKLLAEQLTAQVQPRVFEESFPNTILYVGDVVPGPIARWRPVFIADLTDPKDRKNKTGDAGDAPRITVAAEALVTPDIERNRIQLTLQNVATYEVGVTPEKYSRIQYPNGDQVLEARRRSEIAPARPFEQYDLGPLYKAAQTQTDARIEFHRRLVLPVACLILAMVGIPLGVSSRRGGRSGAFVLTVVLALAYYTALLTLIGLARQKALPVGLAIWLPNIVFGTLGLIFMARLERPGDRDLVGSIRAGLARLSSGVASRMSYQPGPRHTSMWDRLPLLGQIIDTYVLRNFLFYFMLWLLSFVVMTQVFTFFELLSDIVKNRIALSRVMTYLFFLSPRLIYDSTPFSVLVAVLVTFGVMSKQNEVTAFKACGVSLHRMAIPVLMMSLVLSGALFAFDHYVVPDANRKQDAIRAEIKGRPAQTYLRPNQPWIFGKGSRIYNYKSFDDAKETMLTVSVYELDPKSYRISRHISAEQAQWDPSLKTWIFKNGWSRRFDDKGEHLTQFTGRTETFPELDEPPSWFLKEVKQYTQMNYEELSRYIAELQQSGFDTVRLQVQLYKKFAVPLFALIMAMISVPFAFLTGSRGAMAGVGISFGIAIAYFSLSQLFEQVGNMSQLPAAMAAWSPDLVFALAGTYLLARMRT